MGARPARSVMGAQPGAVTAVWGGGMARLFGVVHAVAEAAWGPDGVVVSGIRTPSGYVLCAVLPPDSGDRPLRTGACASVRIDHAGVAAGLASGTSPRHLSGTLLLSLFDQLAAFAHDPLLFVETSRERMAAALEGVWTQLGPEAPRVVGTVRRA